MSEQAAAEFYVTVSDLPQFAGRCQAAVIKRKWEYGQGFSPVEEQCSRSAAYRYNQSRFCHQHHPDPDGAQAAIEREQKIAEEAYRAAKARR